MTDNLPQTPATSDFRPSKGQIGRRTRYNDRIVEQICLYVAEGMSLREISRQPGMPSWSVLKVWQIQHPELRQTIEAIRWVNSTDYIAEALECFKGLDPDSEDFKARLELAKAESAAKFTAARLMELRKPPRQIVENEDDS
ncbi:hypothetical protein N7V59_002711 [Escherichia coli]|uniref:terminase small subunit-like protein n=1 Tax=Escherichia coli TaxID=562 RepID=UPI001A297C47|nr:hypothetical protein [Escherichia coli]EHX4451898.1 hypothetical protein [Escherichia coli]EJV7387480.1 hypothetical protein [Escherichia coli]